MIKLTEVCKNYFRGKHTIAVLKNLDWYLSNGEFISVMGPSGSGKTTLLNIIGCLDIPTSGKCYFNDTDISNLSDSELSQMRNKEIGFVFQKSHLLPYSVYHNVRLPLVYSLHSEKEIEEKVKKTLKMLGISNYIDNTPAQLSAGEQQKVAIARAIVNEPFLICADEPTGSLDRESGLQIASLLKKLNEFGKTIILVTHDEEIARFSTKNFKLKGGKLHKI